MLELLLLFSCCATVWLTWLVLQAAWRNGVADGYGYARYPTNPGYRKAGDYLASIHALPKERQLKPGAYLQTVDEAGSLDPELLESVRARNWTPTSGEFSSVGCMSGRFECATRPQSATAEKAADKPEPGVQ